MFQSGAKSYFKVGQLRQPFISKWDKGYFKVGQRQLFQSMSMFFNVGQSGAKVISKWGKILFQSGAVISKWGITLVT